ncbi:ABC transporter permease [Paenibacillus sp. 2RAB27]|uniref:ABC transporter permease n=1 Tax=Paenibacillus sp. 2RAB27 TaxID=3232991 RepID=UPI003F97658C
MNGQELLALNADSAATKRTGFWRTLKRERYLWLMVLPGILYFIIYKYIPMLGIVIAFQDYNPVRGILNSPWVGLKHFSNLITNDAIPRVMWNTLVISFYQIVLAFSFPIVLAIMINEVSRSWLKRSIQTIVYLPHFLSWPVIAGIFYLMFSSNGGVTTLLGQWGIQDFNLLSDPDHFRLMLVLQLIWKESGWGTIIYLAALLSISPELYEAAKMDGAGRFRQIWHVSLPGLRSTIMILFTLRLGNVLDVGFEQVFLMLNARVSVVGDVLETYLYSTGLVSGKFSFATAVGLLKGVLGFVLIYGSNKVARRINGRGLY